MLNHFNFKLKRDVTIIVPGEVYVSNSNVISTILGSCVSVVLWDEVKKIIGMNHYVLINSDNIIDPSQKNRYGVNAIPSLIDSMLKAGASRERLRAKLFGGANFMPTGGLSVGQENAYFSVSELKRYHIPILAADFKQAKSRKLFAFPEDFKVMVEYPDGAKVY